ncbi:SRPBCC family protein [Actinophytocola sp.]|uniref:SRPBCC family protein n=1 Tax=Actinophytocola sp. TaxID=1872138 RepID=UPI002D806ED0|nr:SRPBCC family protein [Actinophytocola sp.]HET9141029.1 SRPBCC family protein [Actinophytocola sp.]
MQLEHTFRVPADLDTVWQAVLDPELVAPCMPGATLTAVDGSAFSGQVKVKLGPISLLYKGAGEFLETDEQARKVIIKASGKDSRGNGTAAATVTVALRADGAETVGSVLTDLSITGKPAQFGRGMISEVGGKILDSFASCLSSKLAPAPAEPEPAPRLAVVEPVAEQPPPAAAAGGAAVAEPAPRPATPQPKPKLEAVPEPESEPIDLLSYAAPSVLKRAIPVLVLVLAALAVLIVRRRSR